MQGKVIKGIAGAYYVKVDENLIYECKAKGIFRKDGISPLVGDNVEIEIIDEDKKDGIIEKILDRKCELIRPACANIDQVLVVFAATEPEPNLNLLDRFLIMMKKQGIPVILCFNKTDIAGDTELKKLADNYVASGVAILFASVIKSEGLEEVKQLLKGKTTILAGPSGVGKSSLMNALAPFANMETGELSEKIKRGKQTTRHTELICIDENTYLCDSPGFTSMYLFDIESNDLKNYFSEFEAYGGECRFLTCNHISEPDCKVKFAVEEGKISKVRYENYCVLFEELKKKPRR